MDKSESIRTDSMICRRHGLMGPAILIGLLTGGMSVGFHICIDAGELFRNWLISEAHQDLPFGPWYEFAFVFVAVIISASAVNRFAPEAAGSGIPHLKAILLGQKAFRWCRVLIIKFLSTLIGSTAGLILGREGPSVHMGSAIGQALANFWPNKASADRTILVAAGGGAGLAAAFNAPLSGLVFVLEELERKCASLEFFAAAIACLTSDMICRMILGQYPTFHFTISGAPPLNVLIAFLPLGILSAIAGGLFTRALLWSQIFTKLKLWPKLGYWLVLAVLVTFIALCNPELLGGGQNFVNEVLDGKEPLTLETVGLFLIIRFVLTIGSASSGVSGGIFMPILVIGALLGWGVGETTHLWFPELDVNSKLFAVVGMAAYFSAVVQAPLTGIILIIEMTANYGLILPLFIACFSALLIADWQGTPPVYEALLIKDLSNNR